MSLINTINLANYLETANMWLGSVLNKENYQSRFTRYKDFIINSKDNKMFENYFRFHKLYNDYIEIKNELLKKIKKENVDELELYNKTKEITEVFENAIKTGKIENNYLQNVVSYTSFYNSLEYLYNGNIKFLKKDLDSKQKNLMSFYFPNYKTIIDESIKYTLQITEVLKECFDISVVHYAFQNNIEKGFIEKIKIVSSGTDIVEYNKNADERNYLFELIVNAYFKLTNWEIDFSSKTDVVAIKNNVKVFSECKKLTSEKNFKDKLKEAFKQLSKPEINHSNNLYGMVFIDITNIIYNDLKSNLNENKFIIKNENEAIKLIEELISSFILRNTKFIDEQNDKYVHISLATCFYVSLSLLINNETIFFTSKLDYRISNSLNNELTLILEEIVTPLKLAFEPVMLKMKNVIF